MTVAERLKNRLMEDYDISIRPVQNENDVITLNISLNSMTVLVLDPTEETVTFSCEFILQWQDEFLKWNMSEYNITWIKLKEDLVWIPDTTVTTSVSTTSLLDPSDRYVSLKYDGTIRQSIYAVFKNLCDMNVEKFPYDVQKCLINIGPFTYTSSEIHCVAGPEIFENSTYFEGNSEWDFEGVTNTHVYSVDPDVNFTYSEINFTLIVRRRPQFYVWVLLIPTYIITVVCIFGLFTPSSSLGYREERVNLGITTLLSSAVILQIVASSMPKTSELPLLGNFILAEIFVVAIGVLFAVLVLSIHHRAHTREWRPPSWLLWILRMSGSKKFLSKNLPKITRKLTKEEVVQYSGEGANFIRNLDESLTSIREYLNEEERDFHRELTWMKFFDRLDLLLLAIFQIANVLVTVFLVKN
ncbi:unnamed protein product [Caenorhabditis bovis]|uniref:Uncharacterized protein n=1 Tax=Caenorhabditis bovis TaxID=2654633 RepID=A0A8S1FAJ3_9PELO|nr:unnamed protein product [Caenorhabditis bovis]